MYFIKTDKSIDQSNYVSAFPSIGKADSANKFAVIISYLILDHRTFFTIILLLPVCYFSGFFSYSLGCYHVF